MNKWDKYFLKMAILSSTMSKDPSKQVGASIMGPDKSVISTGYNGFPKDMEDDPEMLKNREIKYKYIIHAEDNAIRFANRLGKIPEGSVIYTTFPPCTKCYELIRNAGIKRIVTIEPKIYFNIGIWEKEWEIMKKRAESDGCKIDYYTELQINT